jgi:hypothetical protein
VVVINVQLAIGGGQRLFAEVAQALTGVPYPFPFTGRKSMPCAVLLSPPPVFLGVGLPPGGDFLPMSLRVGLVTRAGAGILGFAIRLEVTLASLAVVCLSADALLAVGYDTAGLALVPVEAGQRFTQAAARAAFHHWVLGMCSGSLALLFG